MLIGYQGLFQILIWKSRYGTCRKPADMFAIYASTVEARAQTKPTLKQPPQFGLSSMREIHTGAISSGRDTLFAPKASQRNNVAAMPSWARTSGISALNLPNLMHQQAFKTSCWALRRPDIP
jgi:hypothetical protein